MSRTAERKKNKLNQVSKKRTVLCSRFLLQAWNTIFPFFLCFFCMKHHSSGKFSVKGLEVDDLYSSFQFYTRVKKQYGWEKISFYPSNHKAFPSTFNEINCFNSRLVMYLDVHLPSTSHKKIFIFELISFSTYY